VPATKRVIRSTRQGLIALALIHPSLAFAQQPPPTVLLQQPPPTVSLSQALEGMASHNPSLIAARGTIDVSRGNLRQASTLTNPGLQATHERLDLGGAELSETYLNLSQLLEWPGTRSTRVRGMEARVEVAEAGFRDVRRELAYRVATSYLDAATADERLRVMEDVIAVIRRAEQTGAARTREGDLSGFDQRRLELERTRYEEMLAEERLRLSRSQRDLAQLIEPADGEPRMGAAGMLPGLPAPPDVVTAVEEGLAYRPDLARMAGRVEVARALLQLQQKERLPDFRVMVGYKSQGDGFKGVFTGLEIPLPVLDRRGGAILAQRAEITITEAEQAGVRRAAEAEIRSAHEAVIDRTQRLRRYQSELAQELFTLLDMALLSYSLGEISLVALLDAASAHRDARIMLIDLRTSCWRAYFELRRAMGLLPHDMPETGGDGS
jgi:cobalt-zinc-cadmium efflux system outer membrane protein